jgi:hypothetical protein
MAEVKTRKKRVFPKMSEQDVVEGLRTRHPVTQWCFMPGFANHVNFRGDRTYDVYCIGLWSGLKHERRVYEVKVSRSDYAHELSKPSKRESALSNSNTFYFAVPHGMVDKDEIPEECGLIYVREDGSCQTIKKAPWREMEDAEKVSYGIFMSMANRASDAEGQNRLFKAMDWKRKQAEAKNPARRLLYHIKELVGQECMDDLAHPTCIKCAEFPENYHANEEQLARYVTEGHEINKYGYNRHHEALRKRKWSLEYHRLAIKRIAYHFMGLELPEEEREPDYAAEAIKRKAQEKEDRKQSKARFEASMAEHRAREDDHFESLKKRGIAPLYTPGTNFVAVPQPPEELFDGTAYRTQ